MIKQRLFIVSNRLPVVFEGEADDVQAKPIPGSLPVAINSFLANSERINKETFWVGVPGCSPSVWQKHRHNLSSELYTYLPVLLYKDQYQGYYNGFSASTLWPLFHYFPSLAEYNFGNFEDYKQVNEHFLEVLLTHLRPSDTVWIHDYHLLPLAGMLRKEMPEITIGFFLHIPFPSYEIFRLIPRKWQEELLSGILGADLIGFHTIDYAGHFLHSIQMVLGLDNDRHIIRYQNRIIKVDVFPISINYQHFNNAYHNQEVTSLRHALKQQWDGKKIIFSVDRLDYTKGILNRLKAYEYFLINNPEYHEKTVLIFVVVPSGDSSKKYAERKKILDETISSINSRIGTFTWQPVLYLYNNISFSEMLAFYTGCNLALITPLRDGMNLAAKEFVTSRNDKKGVLLLSEMAGAARELTSALTINPNDIIEMSAKIKEGLEMDEEEQASRIELMQQRIAQYDIKAWGDDFLNELANIKKKQHEYEVKFIDDFSRNEILNAYRSSGKRLLLLDYDGTLVPFSAFPAGAVPGNHLLELLAELAHDEQNDIYLISGRNSEWLGKEFGHLNVNIIAEHGAMFKLRNEAWKNEDLVQSEWKDKVEKLMEVYVRRCANSFIEMKNFSIVWHFRNANSQQGKLRAQELVVELNQFINNKALQVIPGDKIVEVRNSGIDKGYSIKKILSRRNYDFIFAAGDDRTDEDMFRILLKERNCYTIKVGAEASYAHYNLLTPQMVISMLNNMRHLSKAQSFTSISPGQGIST